MEITHRTPHQAVRPSPNATNKEAGSRDDEGEPWPPESDEGFAFPSPGHYPEEFEPEPRETAGTPKSKVGATSPKASSVKSDKSSIVDRSVLVNKIVEGLRGDAFLLARDLGLETLARPGGLERLIEVIRNHVFPRALEESCLDSIFWLLR